MTGPEQRRSRPCRWWRGRLLRPRDECGHLLNCCSGESSQAVHGEVTFDVTATWALRLGYWYEKYDFSDAFSAGNDTYPLAGAFFLKANDQGYKAHVVYARLVYGF